MSFGISSQLAILVTMLVSSTGLTLGLACVYTHIHVHTRIRASRTAFEMIIFDSEKGGPTYNMLG